MARGQEIPITGSVLQWALDRRGETPESLAAELDLPEQVIQDWLGEAVRPNKTQLAKLSGHFCRPSTFFLLPRPPNDDPLALELRRPPGSHRTAMNRHEDKFLRQARRFQRIASWLAEQNESIVSLSHFDARSSPEEAGEQFRAQLGISMGDQMSWAPGRALANWRERLEQLGLLVFEFSLGKESCRGFSLADRYAPLVALNTHYNQSARVYTLFHECGHLLTSTESLCVGLSLRYDDAVEQWCEEFASAVLLPGQEVARDYAQLPKDPLGAVKILASRYHVSLRAMAVRLIRLDLVPHSIYGQIDRMAVVGDAKEPSGGGKGLSRAERRQKDLGNGFVRLLLDGLDADHLDYHEALDFLGIGGDDLEALRSLTELPTAES